MRRNVDVVARKIHDTFFLINIKEDYSDEKCRLYEINEIGFFLWNNINDDIDIDSLAKLLLKELVGEVDVIQVQNDVEAFITSLTSIRFVEE